MPLVSIHHDESTFFANADQDYYYGDDSITILKQKSLGQSIMVSDFIEEASVDFLQHDGVEECLLLETQSERCNRFLIQVNKAIDIFNSKYPDKQALFIFDNAPSHCKRSDDSLNVK